MPAGCVVLAAQRGAGDVVEPNVAPITAPLPVWDLSEPKGAAGDTVISTAPQPVSPRATARSMYLLHRLLEPNAWYRRLAAWLETRPRLRRLFTAAEKGVKQEIFGCQMCGQCA